MRACAPNVAIAPASSKTPSAREPTRSTTERAGMKAPRGSFLARHGEDRQHEKGLGQGRDVACMGSPVFPFRGWQFVLVREQDSDRLSRPVNMRTNIQFFPLVTEARGPMLVPNRVWP